jgi:hypothetical protein
MCGSLENNKKKITVTKKAAAPMPEGAVVNGVINDEEILFEAFNKLAKSFGPIKNAVLVMDTTHIIYRLSVLPVVSAREMQTLVKGEFVNRNMQDIEYVYDYSVIKSNHLAKKQRLVLSCAVDKKIIDNYKNFFTRTGVKLSGMDFSANAVLQAMANLGNPWENKNAVLCIVDYYIVFIINFLANGEVNFLRSRILSTETNDSYYTEINNVIFSYLQSRKSINRSEETHTLCVLDNNSELNSLDYAEKLAGLGIENVQVGFDSILPVAGVRKDEANIYAYGLFNAAGNAVKNLNFLTAKERKKLTSKQKAIIVLSVLAGVVSFTTGGWLYLLHDGANRMQGLIDEYEAYIMNPQVREAVGLYNTSINEAHALNDVMANLEMYENIVAGTAVMQMDVVNAFYGALLRVDGNAGISRIAFDSEQRSLTFDCFSAEPLMVSEFVEGLRNTGMFTDIVYVRYASSGDGFIYTLECFVREVKPVE